MKATGAVLDGAPDSALLKTLPEGSLDPPAEAAEA
jgi:hypothetical protein